MSVQLVLLAVLFAGMAAVGRGRGVRAFFTLVFDAGALYLMLLLMAYGADPVAVAECGGVAVAAVVLFWLNGVHRKTVAALAAVAVVLAAVLAFADAVGGAAKIAGFGREQAETVSVLSLSVPLDFTRIASAALLIGLFGAAVDVAVSVASPVCEVALHNPSASAAALFGSGMRIGRDVLGAMTNTLVYVYVGESMALLLWYGQYHYSFAQMLGDKLFCAAVLQILAGGIGVALTVPVASLFTALLLRPPFGRRRFRHPEKGRPPETQNPV